MAMAKYKLIKLVEKESITFNFGEKSVTINHEGVDVSEDNLKAILRDYPGWIEPVTEPDPAKKKLVAGGENGIVG